MHLGYLFHGSLWICSLKKTAVLYEALNSRSLMISFVFLHQLIPSLFGCEARALSPTICV